MKKKILSVLLVCCMLLASMTAMAEWKPVRYCLRCKSAANFVEFRKYSRDRHDLWYRCTSCNLLQSLALEMHTLEQHEGKVPTCTEYGWNPYVTCDACGYTTYESLNKDPNNHDLVEHEGKAPTCMEYGWDAYQTCTRCDYSTYQKLPVQHDLVHHEGKEWSCTEKGWLPYDTCNLCDYSTYRLVGPHFGELVDPKEPTCTEIGWQQYIKCSRCDSILARYIELPMLPHDTVSHEGKAPTCTEKGWTAYETCKNCDYSTYQELSPRHEIVHRDAQAPTCTEEGWEAYDECTRCDYSTYQALPALRHDPVSHEAQAATCTEIGWEAYETCNRCDYTTYAELSMLGHDYQKTVIQPTCEEDGYAVYTCSRCEDTYTENPVQKLYHWYGEWTPSDADAHSADCRREDCAHAGKAECEKFDYRLLFADAEDYAFMLCPVCGAVSDDAQLALVAEAAAQAEHLPQGELVLRLGDLQNGERILSVGFEYNGHLTQPTEPIQISLPAELVEGNALYVLAADGTETELPFAVTDETVNFTLNFDVQDEIPVRVLHLVPVQ